MAFLKIVKSPSWIKNNNFFYQWIVSFQTIFPLILLEYKLISKIGEGTFSEVIKAQNIKTGKLVAIKCMKEKISIDKVSHHFHTQKDRF